jgi:hypothetical protein
MENYQKIEKIGEGKPPTALSVKFRPHRRIFKIRLSGRDIADSVSQVHTVSSTRLATLHMLAE